YVCDHGTHRDIHSFPTRRSSDLEHVVQTGFYRANLDLAVIPVSAYNKEQQLLQQVSQQQGCGIVYVTLQKSAEQVASYLQQQNIDRKSTRLNSSHVKISYAVFCL